MFASAATPIARRADPYRDTDIIDARAPRFNQTIVATVSLLAVWLGWWPLLGVLVAQLAVGLRFGRRYCVPCVLYFELVQPRLTVTTPACLTRAFPRPLSTTRDAATIGHCYHS